jgi:hypothetical protein
MERLESIQKNLSKQQLKKPIKVTITGAVSNIGYALVFMIGQGRLFGSNQPVDLTLLEVPAAENQMGVAIMELNDCVYPL